MANKCKTEKELNEYSSPFNVNNQLYFCGVPFRMDSYNGCEHGCTYCFVRSAELTSHSRKNRNGIAHGGNIMVPETKDVQRVLVNALDTNEKRADINIEWLRHRMPIHWGGMSDPFQPCERKFGVSKQWMKYLNWYEYPVVFSTKATLMAFDKEYLQLLREGKYAAQVSLITDDADFIRQLEPGAPSPEDRMKALAIMADAGIWTAVRMQPIIPDSVVEWKMPEFVEKMAKIGVKHIVAEGYKVPVRNPVGMETIWKLAPQAKFEYDYSDTNNEGFERLLPARRKWKYYKLLLEVCHANGMTLGAADNDMRDLGDTVCCCGTDNIPGFENYWKYQASMAAKIAKEKGYVFLEDMQQFWTGGDKEFSVHNDLLKNSGKPTTPQWCVDFFWDRGGANSPECIDSMKKVTIDGKLAYQWTDRIPVWEAQDTKQERMF